MQLTPRYGADPVITLDGSPADIAGPAIRQRHRLAAALASFSDEQWAHPSRCDGWSSRDVIVHTGTLALAVTDPDLCLAGDAVGLSETFDVEQT